MAFTADSIPDLEGSVAVVTGANGGLGLETARALAGAGAHVVMAVRNLDKAAAAEADIRHEHPQSSLALVPLDLGSLDSVRTGAGAISDAHDRVDILVNNAGIMGIPEGRTADGFEIQLGVNHLGHFALTALLLEPLLRAQRARVVQVTSIARYNARTVDPADPYQDGRYRPWGAYGQSKLANYHFGLGLHRQFRSADVSAMSVLAHPGLTNSDLQSTSVAETGGGRSQRFWHALARNAGMSTSQGALPQIRAATDRGVRSGELYAPRFVIAGPPVRRPIVRRWDLDSAVRRLWRASESETGIELDVAATRAAM